MVAETITPVEAVAEAVEANSEAAAKTVAAAAEKGAKTVAAVANTGAKAAKKTARKTRRATKRKTAKRSTTARKTAKSKAQPKERIEAMKYEPTNMFAGLGAFPGANAFEKMFSEAGVRSEDVVKRSRKTAEEFADMTRGNIEALTEAGKIAATGAQSIGQDMVAKGRDSIEQTASTVRSFAEAKSPTELLQLQSEYARSAFDRFVQDSSNLTESLVKLAGEAIQPLSNRASANVEKFNDITA